MVERARVILSELERTERERPARNLVEDLPLFAAAARPAPESSTPEPDRLREALADLDPDALTPREALEALYRLKAIDSE
ncbi:MAG: hypothetical protein ACJ79O_07040 [Myxococcales bacterium]